MLVGGRGTEGVVITSQPSPTGGLIEAVVYVGISPLMSPSLILCCNRCPSCRLCLPHAYHTARSGGGSPGPVVWCGGEDGARGSGDMQRGQFQQRAQEGRSQWSKGLNDLLLPLAALCFGLPRCSQVPHRLPQSCPSSEVAVGLGEGAS